VHQAPVVVTGNPDRGFGEELFGADQCLVSSGQHTVGDQDVAQVVCGLAMWVGVEGLVGAGDVAGGEFGEHLRVGAAS
jgi:hypothetical protein